MDTARQSLLASLGCMCSNFLYKGTRVGSAQPTGGLWPGLH